MKARDLVLPWKLFGMVKPKEEDLSRKRPFPHALGLTRAVYVVEDHRDIKFAFRHGFETYDVCRVDVWYNGSLRLSRTRFHWESEKIGLDTLHLFGNYRV